MLKIVKKKKNLSNNDEEKKDSLPFIKPWRELKDGDIDGQTFVT